MISRLTLVGCLAIQAIATSLVLAQSEESKVAMIGGSLQDGDRIALCGDSITEAKNYTAIIEGYLLSCQPAGKYQVSQFGWGGETTWNFKTRIANDVLWFKPSVATVCYGMNDGGYGPLDPKRLEQYNTSTRDIVAQFKAAGVRQIVLVGPGIVDESNAFRGNKEAAIVYNKTLAAFNSAAREIAVSEGVAFADLNTVMLNAMHVFKAKYPDRSFVGGDGIHPENVGHMVMAYAILKALGCDGNIGTITFNLASSQATATAGHVVTRSEKGEVDIESSRYPFPVTRNDDPASLGAALDLVPFNQDLNRFMLAVTDANAARYRVTWGKSTVEFDGAALRAGVNLADTFRTSPFSQAFGRVDSAVHAQQDFETPLIKQFIHELDEWIKMAPESESTWRETAEGGKKLDELLRKRAAGCVVPVRHTIRVEALP